MTVSAPQSGYGLVAPGVEVRAYRAPRAEVFGAAPLPPEGLSWRRDDRLHLGRLFLGSGARPAQCDLALSHRADEGRVARPNLMERSEDLDPLATLQPGSGLPGVTWAPAGWQRFDVLKLCLAPDALTAEDDAAACKFVGYLVGWTEDLATGAAVLHFADARWLLHRVMVFGRMWWCHQDGEPVWLAGDCPRFNGRGRRNLFAASEAGRPCFVDDDHEEAEYWTPGHVWNYLRWLYTVQPPPELADCRRWLDWPEASPEGWGRELFETAGEANQLFDVDMGGLHLAHALELAVRKRSDLEWTLAYDAVTGKARPAVYGVGADSLVDGQRRLSLARGEIGADVATAGAEVIGGSLCYSAEATRTRVRGLGAPRRYDLSLNTVDGTLVRGWTDNDQTEWLALYDGDPDDETEAKKVYPAVFRRWVVNPSLDWRAEFGWSATLQRARKTLAELESFDGAETRRRIRLQLWRSTDGGANWEKVPEEMSPVAAHDTLGFELPEGAREEREWDEEVGPENYSWDPDAETAYDFAVTLAVEGDERLSGADELPVPDWPVLEALVLEEDWGWSARVGAWLLTDAAGRPTENALEGSRALLGSASSPEVIRDDSGAMDAFLARTRSRTARTAFTGDVVLKGIRADISPGDYLWRLTGGGSEGTRPDIEVSAMVDSVAYEFGAETQTTALGLRAD